MMVVSEIITVALTIPTAEAASDQEAEASVEAAADSDPAAVEAVASEVADNF